MTITGNELVRAREARDSERDRVTELEKDYRSDADGQGIPSRIM